MESTLQVGLGAPLLDQAAAAQAGRPRIAVEVFHLTDYKKATVCYALANPAPGARPHVVLHRGDVNDAHAAVLSVLREANRDSE
jgi:hypothetical protein